MKKLKLKKTLCLLMALVMGLSLAGCGGSSSSSSSEEESTEAEADTSEETSDDDEKVLYVGLANDITTLDYANNYTLANFQVVDNINDFLLLYDENGEMQPNICTEWEAVDELTYVYQIRDDAVFSDGTPMTIDDVVYSMQRIMDPATGSDMNWAYENVESIEATGEWELTVTLSTPDATWQYIPATPGCQITSQAYCEEAGDSFGTADGLTIGTGAYKVESWTTGSEVVLVKNEYYWGEEGYYDKIVYTVINDENSMAMALTSGQIDFCMPASTDLASVYEEAEGSSIYSVNGISCTLLSFNTSTGQCADVNLRKAIASCVDTVSLLESQLGDYAEAPTAAPFGTGLYVLDEETWTERINALDAYDYDLEEAAEYLAASDYDGSTLTFVIIEGNNAYANYAQAIQAAAASIGINIEIEKVTNSEYYAHAYGTDLDEDGNRQYDLMINRWTPDYVDPVGDLMVFYHSNNIQGGANYASYSNPDVDALLEEQAGLTDNLERSELLIQCVELANEDCVYKALYYQTTIYAISDDVEYDLPGYWLYSIQMKDFKPVDE